jgi:hypothetical protein
MSSGKIRFSDAQIEMAHGAGGKNAERSWLTAAFSRLSANN